MKNTNYEDYEQMSTEILNSKYNNIGIQKKSKNFLTKQRLIIILFSISFIILLLYLIFRPSKKNSEENKKSSEDSDSNSLEQELNFLSKKEEELKNENEKLKTQKDSLKKENDNLNKEINELKEKNKKNENNHKNNEKEIEEKKGKITDFEKKIKEEKDKNEELNKKGKELKDKKDEIDKEVSSIQSKIDELEKELKNNENEEPKKEEKTDIPKTDEPKKEEEPKKTDEPTPQPPNPELISRIDTKIITEYKHLELLDKWFGRKLKYKLLYRATEEQYSSSKFHSKVDNYKNSIIFIKDVNNFIYGGFTTRTWDGNRVFKSDKNAILFNLDKEKYYEINNSEKAIFCDKDILAYFGEGDLILGPKSIESNFPKSYGSDKSIKENELTMGYNKLSPVEMEVFQLS